MKVACKAWRLCVDRDRFCGSVTERLRGYLNRGHVFIQERRRSSVFSSLACACCEVLCGITAFVWIK